MNRWRAEWFINIILKTWSYLLVLINEAAGHGDVWKRGCIAPLFLNLALDGGEWLASRYCRFNTKNKAPGTHYVGGWVCPRVRSVYYWEHKNLMLLPNPGSSAAQLIVHHYVDWAIPTPLHSVELRRAKMKKETCLVTCMTVHYRFGDT
jgi:hypothetical protein